MRKLFLVLLCVAMTFFTSISFAQNDEAQYQLQKAKSLLDDGDYSLALRRFERISSNYDFPMRVKREASYYIGYCYVKQSDPWRAIEIFQDFIRRYEDSGDDFIPDALYVMGRAHEEINETRQAIRAYRRCVREYSHSAYARKAQRQLNTLDDNNGGNGSDPYDDDYDNGDGSYVSSKVKQIIRLARRQNVSYLKDQYILDNIRVGKTGQDFIAMCNEIDNNYTKKLFLDKVVRNKNFRHFKAKAIISLSKAANNSVFADQFLFDAAKVAKLASSGYKQLAKNCSNAYLRSEILRIAKEAINDSDNYGDNDDYYHGGVSRQIRDILEMAKLETNSYTKDQYLLSAAHKAKGGEDFLALLKAMTNSYTKGELLGKIETHPAFKRLSPRVVVKMAKQVGNDYTMHEFLVTAANKIAFTPSGYRTLAEACNNSFYRQQILEKAKDHLDYGYSTTSNRNGLGRNVIEKRSSDPFIGYKANKAQTKRISKFIKAIKIKKGIEKAVRNLTKQDLKIPTVKKNMKTFRAIQKFNKVHNN